MSDAHLDPAVLVSATIRGHRKILNLTIEERWAYIVLLGEAKLSRPPGQFDNRTVLDYKMAELAPCVEAHLREGFIHAAPTRCNDCRALFGIVDRGVILVHNWQLQQGRSTARVRKHRREHGLTSGHQTLADVVSARFPSVSPDASPSVTPALLRARGSRSHSQDVDLLSSGGGAGEGADDPLDAVEQWLAEHRIHGGGPGSRTHTALARLADQEGAPVVIAAFERLAADHPELREAPQFVFGAQKLLHPIPDVHGPNRPAAKGHSGSEALQGAVERV